MSLLDEISSVGGSQTARVLATANSVSGGAVASLLFNNPLGRLAADAGYKLAAAGGNLTKGILVWNGFSPTTQTYQDQTFVFPMNPEELTESLSPEWHAHKVPGQNRPIYHFVNGGERELSFKLHFFYDSPDRRLITKQIQELKSLTQRPYNIRQPGAVDGPPPVYFYFGEYVTGDRFIVEKLSVRAFDLFDPLYLLPLRAEVDITLKEAEDPALGTGGGAKIVPAVSGRASAGSILTSIGNPF